MTPCRSFLGIQIRNSPRRTLALPALLREAQLRVICGTLIVIGLAILAVGLLWPWLSKLGLGRLPGDIVVERENFTFYFPIVTGLVVSVVLSLVLWLLNR